jgi:hypothetical protein
MSGFEVLVTGAGAVGGHAVEFLARRPDVHSIAVVDINPQVAEGVAWRATLGALQEGKHVRTKGFGVDLLNQDAADAALASIQPRVVFHAATLLTVPEMARGLRPETFERVRDGGMAGFLSAHLVLGMKVQAAIAKLAHLPPMIMASFPDFTNQVLARVGTAPLTGIGNVDNMAVELQAIVAEKLGVRGQDVVPIIVAHHSVAEWFQRSGSAGAVPWFARVLVDGVDRSIELDLARLMTESSKRIRGVPQEQRTAASGVKAVLAVLRDDGTYIHSAGPLGRPGGWPARIWADRLDLVPVPGLDEAHAMEIALAGQQKGGCLAIEEDGTIVATEGCRTMMQDVFGIDVTRVAPADVEPTARALRQALTRLIAARG